MNKLENRKWPINLPSGRSKWTSRTRRLVTLIVDVDIPFSLLTRAQIIVYRT